jgi:succinate dehydrogenase / fumarate reductase cytochrome b subunit
VSTVAPPEVPSQSSTNGTNGADAVAKDDIEFAESAKATQPTFNDLPGRRHFLIRRLHSALGLVFGGYITVHLIINASAALSPKVFQKNVDHIHSLEPMLPFIEIAAIFGPLAFHALYGIYIAFSGVKFNTTKYHYGGNVRYFLQRWTAVILLAFIAFHVGTLHKWGFHLVYSITHIPWLSGYSTMGLFNPDDNQAFDSTVSGVKFFWNADNPWNPGNVAVMAFYLLGVWSAVFHWANGLWTSAIVWGLTVTRQSQKRWGNVCCAFGIVMLIIGTIAWAAFTVSSDHHLYNDSDSATTQVQLPVSRGLLASHAAAP